MDKNTYYVYTQKFTGSDPGIKTGGICSGVLVVPNCINLVGYFQDRPEWQYLNINAVSTKKEAEKIARQWNHVAYEKGIYAFA